MKKIIEELGINNFNLSLRKEFIQLSDSDIKVLKRLNSWAEKYATKIAKEFYDHQFAFSQTKNFFQNYANQKNIPLNNLRNQLEKSQTNYFKEIFIEANNGSMFDENYFEKRLRVGVVHNVINLPLKWYLGSYVVYQNLVNKYLYKHFFFRPSLRRKAQKAIFTIFNYDIQSVVDSFIFDFLDTVGISFKDVEIKDNKLDFSDYYDAKKDAVQKKIEEKIQVQTEFTNYTKKSIDLFSESINKFLNGDLSVSLSKENEDEIGIIFDGFNRMISKIKNIVEHIFDLSTVIASSSAQISSTAEEMSSGSREQVSHSGEVASAMEELSASIIENSRNAGNVAQISEQAVEIAKTGGESINETIVEMKKMAEVVNNSSVVVKELGKSSEQIGEIISVISDIADQTNLLALNAAIEAARAGEHGRGFAVVADEVKKLAEKTAKSTKEIKDIINKIQQNATSAVDVMATGMNEVEEGIKVADKAGNALNEIIAAIGEVRDMINQIVVSNQQQAKTSSEVSRNVEGISNIIQQMSDGISQLATTADDLSRKTVELNHFTSLFNLGNKKQNESVYKENNSYFKMQIFENADKKLDIEFLKTSHKLWRSKFRSFINGDKNIDSSEFTSHRQCKLGQWYYNEGMKNFGKLPDFIELGKVHEKFHDLGVEIMIAKEKNNIIEMNSKYKELDKCTNQIISLLDNLVMNFNKSNGRENKKLKEI
ncbi:MAG: hypothetical protein STSR0008_18180 [Ignavibacterium sp.]